MKTHKDLDAWKLSMALATKIYELTRAFPKEELFGLTSQMRRAAISIPSNLAEGAGRNGDKEFLRFLTIAAGSASELDTQIEIARSVGMGNREKLDETQKLTNQVARILQGLIRSIKARTQ